VEEKLENTRDLEELITINDMRSSLNDLDDVDKAKIGEARAGKRFVKIHSDPDIFVYLGLDEDYVILKDIYCSCNGFFIQVLGEGKKKHCSHLAALHNIDDDYLDLSDSFDTDKLFTIILEVLYSNRSKTLRRIVYGVEEFDR
jgi:predicted nucleic acid-binding Zn finger protein